MYCIWSVTDITRLQNVQNHEQLSMITGTKPQKRLAIFEKTIFHQRSAISKSVIGYHNLNQSFFMFPRDISYSGVHIGIQWKGCSLKAEVNRKKIGIQAMHGREFYQYCEYTFRKPYQKNM